MSVSVSSVLDRVSKQLGDDVSGRWTQSELVDWVNEGQRQIVLHVPEEGATVSVLALASGALQTLPANCIQLLDVVRNMGNDTVTPGGSVELMDRKELDAEVPDWSSQTPSATVDSVAYNAKVPKRFYVSPPQPSSGRGSIEIHYVAVPATVTANDNISISDSYDGALVDYVCFRALMDDSETGDNLQRASAHWQSFAGAVGIREEIRKTFDPNKTYPNDPRQQ